MKTLKIELRVDFSDDRENKEKILEDAMKVAAKHMLTTALLLKDKRPPTIALYGGDLFTSEEEIMLADDIPPEQDQE